MKTLLLLFAGAVAAVPTTFNTKANLVYQAPTVGTWFENLAVRRNGSLLLTSIGAPVGVHTLNPLEDNPQPILLHEFPNFNSTVGITEAELDVFYVVVSNGSINPLGVEQGTNNVFRLVFNDSGLESVAHVSHLKEAGLLNGLLALDASTVLAADSGRGIIWAIDTTSGEYRKAIDVKYFAPPSYFPFTVNGLKWRGSDRSTLWFTNTAKAGFGYLPIGLNGTAIGRAVQLTTSIKYGGDYDDFVFDQSGDNAYAAVGGGNCIEKIVVGSKQNVLRTSRFAGHLNSTEIAEPTAARFGRTAMDNHILYITTGGASGIPVIRGGKQEMVGAQILAIPTS